MILPEYFSLTIIGQYGCRRGSIPVFFCENNKKTLDYLDFLWYNMVIDVIQYVLYVNAREGVFSMRSVYCPTAEKSVDKCDCAVCKYRYPDCDSKWLDKKPSYVYTGGYLEDKADNYSE